MPDVYLELATHNGYQIYGKLLEGMSFFKGNSIRLTFVKQGFQICTSNITKNCPEVHSSRILTKGQLQAKTVESMTLTGL